MKVLVLLVISLLGKTILAEKYFHPKLRVSGINSKNGKEVTNPDLKKDHQHLNSIGDQENNFIVHSIINDDLQYRKSPKRYKVKIRRLPIRHNSLIIEKNDKTEKYKVVTKHKGTDQQTTRSPLNTVNAQQYFENQYDLPIKENLLNQIKDNIVGKYVQFAKRYKVKIRRRPKQNNSLPIPENVYTKKYKVLIKQNKGVDAKNKSAVDFEPIVEQLKDRQYEYITSSSHKKVQNNQPWSYYLVHKSKSAANNNQNLEDKDLVNDSSKENTSELDVGAKYYELPDDVVFNEMQTKSISNNKPVTVKKLSTLKDVLEMCLLVNAEEVIKKLNLNRSEHVKDLEKLKDLLEQFVKERTDSPLKRLVFKLLLKICLVLELVNLSEIHVLKSSDNNKFEFTTVNSIKPNWNDNNVAVSDNVNIESFREFNTRRNNKETSANISAIEDRTKPVQIHDPNLEILKHALKNSEKSLAADNKMFKPHNDKILQEPNHKPDTAFVLEKPVVNENVNTEQEKIWPPKAAEIQSQEAYLNSESEKSEKTEEVNLSPSNFKNQDSVQTLYDNLDDDQVINQKNPVSAEIENGESKQINSLEQPDYDVGKIPNTKDSHEQVIDKSPKLFSILRELSYEIDQNLDGDKIPNTKTHKESKITEKANMEPSVVNDLQTHVTKSLELDPNLEYVGSLPNKESLVKENASQELGKKSESESFPKSKESPDQKINFPKLFDSLDVRVHNVVPNPSSVEVPVSENNELVSKSVQNSQEQPLSTSQRTEQEDLRHKTVNESVIAEKVNGSSELDYYLLENYKKNIPVVEINNVHPKQNLQKLDQTIESIEIAKNLNLNESAATEKENSNLEQEHYFLELYNKPNNDQGANPQNFAAFVTENKGVVPKPNLQNAYEHDQLSKSEEVSNSENVDLYVTAEKENPQQSLVAEKSYLIPKTVNKLEGLGKPLQIGEFLHAAKSIVTENNNVNPELDKEIEKINQKPLVDRIPNSQTLFISEKSYVYPEAEKEIKELNQNPVANDTQNLEKLLISRKSYGNLGVAKIIDDFNQNSVALSLIPNSQNSEKALVLEKNNIIPELVKNTKEVDQVSVTDRNPDSEDFKEPELIEVFNELDQKPLIERISKFGNDQDTLALEKNNVIQKQVRNSEEFHQNPSTARILNSEKFDRVIIPVRNNKNLKEKRVLQNRRAMLPKSEKLYFQESYFNPEQHNTGNYVYSERYELTNAEDKRLPTHKKDSGRRNILNSEDLLLQEIDSDNSDEDWDPSKELDSKNDIDFDLAEEKLLFILEKLAIYLKKHNVPDRLVKIIIKRMFILTLRKMKEKIKCGEKAKFDQFVNQIKGKVKNMVHTNKDNKGNVSKDELKRILSSDEIKYILKLLFEPKLLLVTEVYR